MTVYTSELVPFDPSGEIAAEENRMTIEVNLEERDGEVFVPIPEELARKLGWKIGDMIDWILNPDGSFTLRKRDA